jgi:alpha-N-arabinofuranosidase
VLQAVVLTKDGKMVLTPTYYVFDLYQHHMDARELGCTIEAAQAGTEKHTLPGITASASEKDGVVTVTLTNLDPDRAEEVEICAGAPVKEAKGRILQGKMGEYNDFDNAPLKTEAFSDFSIQGDTLRVKMPGCAVAEIRMKVSE